MVIIKVVVAEVLDIKIKKMVVLLGKAKLQGKEGCTGTKCTNGRI